MDNEALWLDGPGREPRIGTAELYEPGEDELLVKVMAIPVQPGEWKIREGLIPIPLKYPTIIGLGISGVVQKVGPGVTRFKPGDRIMSNTSGVLRGDYRFGAYQKFCLVPAALTSKYIVDGAQIGETPFKEAANLSTAYAPTSALFLHLGLNRPQAGNRNENPTREKVLIWGISSSLGGIAAQMAADAGYSVVGVASGRHAELAKSLGISSFVDRSSPEVVPTLTGLGPFKAVFAAADSAEDQVKIGEVLAAHGGGTFLSTMGVRKGVQLPQGVSGKFSQYIDDYLSPDNREFTQWVWWDYLEKAVSQGRLKSTPVEGKGDLSQTMAAWKALKAGEVSGKRLVICPNSE